MNMTRSALDVTLDQADAEAALLTAVDELLVQVRRHPARVESAALTIAIVNAEAALAALRASRLEAAALFAGPPEDPNAPLRKE
jgi:hypothetical protein